MKEKKENKKVFVMGILGVIFISFLIMNSFGTNSNTPTLFKNDLYISAPDTIEQYETLEVFLMGKDDFTMFEITWHLEPRNKNAGIFATTANSARFRSNEEGAFIIVAEYDDKEYRKEIFVLPGDPNNRGPSISKYL